MKVLSLLLILVLSGCASNTKGMTADEKEYYYANRDAIDQGNWSNCRKVYSQSGMYTIHKNHQHHRPSREKHKPAMQRRFETQADLHDNLCRMVINDEYWQKY